MSSIFISHSSADNQLAVEVGRRLEREAGHSSIFLDLDPEKGITAGESWERTLYRKLRACEAVLVLCTDNYLASHWCFAEIALARMEGKHIIALLADPLGADAKLPAILTETQYIDLRTDPEVGYRALWKGLDEKQILGVDGDWDPSKSPYLGLDAFQEEHAPIFFGREDESRVGLELLGRGAPPLIMVVGSSGSGKSSLVRAGMLPRLRRDKKHQQHWILVDPFRPGADPFAELATSLEAAVRRHAPKLRDQVGDWTTIRDRLVAAADALGRPGAPTLAPDEAPAATADSGWHDGRTSPLGDERLRRLLQQLEDLREEPPEHGGDRLRDFLDWSLEDLRRIGQGVAPRAETASVGTALVGLAESLRRADPQRRAARVLLVIDQFEELLGHEERDHRANRFLRLIRATLDVEHSPLMVLGTMRSDFLEAFQRNPALVGIGFETLSVGPMTIDGLRRVIEKPAERGAVTLEAGLADRLLADAHTPDALPLLSFTLWKLWGAYGEDALLELDEYVRLGGLQGAIAAEADWVLNSPTATGREEEVRRALLRMARITEDGHYARRTVRWDEEALRPVHDILDLFVERRLLRIREEDGARLVEVAHEVLFRCWAPLEGWLAEHRSQLLLSAQIKRDAETWQAQGRAEEILWPGGGRLQQASEIARSGGLSPVERAFVEAAVDLRQRRARRKMRIAAAVGVALVGAAAFSAVQERKAVAERVRALDLARVAVANERLEEDPNLAALVLLEVQNPDETGFWAERAREAINAGLSRVAHSSGAPLTASAFSRDGRLAATGDGLGVARVSTSDAMGAARELDGHTGAITSLAFSPDGSKLVTGSRDGTALLWDLQGDSATVRADLSDATGAEVWAVDFSPDGGSILTASRAVRVFDGDGNGPTRVFTEHAPSQVWAARFGPDGRRVVSAGEDHTARVWSVADPAGPTVVLAGHTDRVTDASFSPDGERIVTASYDGTARLWSSDGRGDPRVLEGHTGVVSAAAFSPDGYAVVTASHDSTTRVWRTDEGGLPVVLRGHRGPVARASFSPDGALVLSASGDGSARLWRADGVGDPAALEGRGDAVVDARFSPDGSRILTASAGGSAAFWHGRGRNDPVPTSHLDARVDAAAFSPDGRTLVALSFEDDVVRATLLSPDRPADARTVELLDQYDPASAVALAADAQRLVAVAPEGDPTVYAIQGGGAEAIRVGDGATAAVALDPGGGRVAFLALDGTLRIRSLDDAASTTELGEHRDAVSVFFDHAGARLATLSLNGSIRVWAVESDGGRELRTLGDTVGPTMRGGAFSPDGRRLVTFADDSVAYVWSVGDGARVAALRGHTDRIVQVSFDTDGARILTASTDGSARIWRADGALDPIVLKLGGDPVRAAAFDSDREAVTTVSADGTIRSWSAITHEGLRRELRQATNGCLTVEFQTLRLGRDPQEAERRFRACEASFERTRPSPRDPPG